MSTAKHPEASPNGSDDAPDSFDDKKRNGTLTRQDLALAIYKRFGNISRREAKRITDSVIDEMVETLTSGESLKLHDFGSFIVRSKHERAGRNPRTGDPVPIEARRVVVFKASPNMKAAVDGKAPVADLHADAVDKPAKELRKSQKAAQLRKKIDDLAIGQMAAD